MAFPHRFQVHLDQDGGFRWRLLDDDHSIVAKSTHSYIGPQEAMASIQRLREGEVRVEMDRDSSRRFWWRMVDAEDVPLCISDHGLPAQAQCEAAALRTLELAHSAPMYAPEQVV